MPSSIAFELSVFPSHLFSVALDMRKPPPRLPPTWVSHPTWVSQDASASTRPPQRALIWSFSSCGCWPARQSRSCTPRRRRNSGAAALRVAGSAP